MCQYSTVTALVLTYSMRASSPVKGEETRRAPVSNGRLSGGPKRHFLTEVFAEAGLLEASEGRGHVGLVVGVDEDGPSLQALAHVHGLVDVPGEDSRGQAVLCVVGPLQNSFHIPAGRSNRSRAPPSRAASRARLATYPSWNLDTTITGPKDSSLAMNMWSSTSVKTVGSMKKPAGNIPSEPLPGLMSVESHPSRS